MRLGSKGAFLSLILVAAVAGVVALAVREWGAPPEPMDEGSAVTALPGVGAVPGVAAPGDGSAAIDVPAGGAARTLRLGEAALEIAPGALGKSTRIVIEKLREGDMARLDSGLVNVTKAAPGYRFLPHDQKFAGKATVRLPYDPALLPGGFAETDIRTFTFDAARGLWAPLERVSVDAATKQVVSLTDHFSDMINGVVVAPEHPEAALFNPTQIKDMKVANPGARVNLIAPPEANAMGEARLFYPIELPPGRAGLAPALSLTYNSSAANGWLGLGWDLQTSMITIDTRWGAPRYLADKESETYLIDGEQMTPMAHRSAFVDRTSPAEGKIFHTRVEGRFRDIRRFGDAPANYRWEVRDKDGTIFFYGGDRTALDSASVLTDDANANSGAVFRWMLKEIRDANGNTVRYSYARQSDAGTGNGMGPAPGHALYCKAIEYTGRPGEAGAYRVSFTRDRERGETRRPDMTIDARGGFKLVVADLLRRIDVTFNGAPVRSYEFAYARGAFDKTLLQRVTQFDADGAEFNHHDFSYFDEARTDSAAYRGFAARADWNAGADDVRASGLAGDLRASGLSGFEGTGSGGHLYVGVGPLPAKSNSVGFKSGSSSNRSEGLLALIDINGDGLPDKVFREGGQIMYRRNRSGPGAGATTTFGPKTPVAALPAISREKSSSASTGPEAYVGGGVNGFVGLNLSSTDVESSVYFIDVNGDGLVDLASGGVVLFNRVNAAGDPEFAANSAGTPYPVGPGAVAAGTAGAELQAIAARQNASHPKIDSLRRWVAPFDGVITITGPVALLQDPAASGYGTADGVRVAIQLNASELWSAVIGPTDFAPRTPDGVANLAVHKGDVVYFRVQSIHDGAFDRVAWAPQIAYSASPTVDSDGLDPYAYDSARDFTLLAAREATITAPLNGVARVTGALIKSAPVSDDAVLELLKNGVVIASRPIPAAAGGSYAFNESVAVLRDVHDENGNQTQVGDRLSVRLRIDSRLDLTKFQWAPDAPPRLTYTSAPDLPAGAPLPVVDVVSSATLYPESDLAAPLAPWVAPADGSFTFEAEVTGGADPFVLTAKRPVSLLAKTSVTPGAPVRFTLAAAAGDRIFFEFHGASATGVTARRIRLVSGDVPQDPELPSALYAASADDILPQRHRGWNAFGYDGNLEAADQPVALSQNDLTLASLGGVDRNGYRAAIEDAIRNGTDPTGALGSPFRLKALPYVPDYVEARLEGPDLDLFASAAALSASRRGVKAILDPARFAGGRAAPRLSAVTQRAVAGGAGLGVDGLGVEGSASFASTESRAILEFRDLNGDQFPDVVAPGLSVQFSPPTGGLEEAPRGVGAGPFAQESKSGSFSFGTGGSFARASANAKADFDARVGAPPSPNGDAAQIEVPVGVSGAVSKGGSDVASDLVDINGDGLPDRLSAVGGQLRLRLNLGYAFAPEELWDAGAVNKGENRSEAGGGSLGYNDGIYGFAGGINASRHESGALFALQDFNGDGLLDRVRVDARTAAVVSVAMNAGAGFMAELAWPGADGAGLANAAQETQDAGAYFTASFCPTGVGFCVVSNPGASSERSLGRGESSVVDMDGDGHPDHVASTSDDRLSVGLNPTGRTNLLKGVRRPLGGSFELSYVRTGNSYDQQPSRWALARVMVNDGQPGDGQDLTIRTFAWEGGVWERRERQFYGYRRCVETHHDPARVTDLDAVDAPYRAVTRLYRNDSFYTKTLLEKETLADAQGRPFTEVENSYDVRDEATQETLADPQSLTATGFPRLVRTDRRWFEGQPAAGKTTFETFEYDRFGNIVRYFDASDAQADDDVESLVSYHQDLPSYIVGKADAVRVFGGGVLMRERQATFEAGTGNLLQARRLLSDGAMAAVDMTYDGFGNLATVTGPANHKGDRYALAYAYDPVVHTHVASVTDSFGYVSTADYDLRWGLPSLLVDVNGQQVATVHDAKGRPATVTGPHQQGSGLATIAMAYHPEAAVPWAKTAHVDADRDPADTIDATTFVDGLGRVIQTKKDLALHVSGDSAQDVAAVSGRAVYDGFGRVIEQYYPTTEALGAQSIFNPAFDPAPPTRTAYDMLDRKTRVANPANETTTFAYDFAPDREGRLQFRTSMRDPRNVLREALRDVDDDITMVNLFNDGGAVVQRTSYAYDPLDQILSVTDDRGNVTRAAYDAFGRRVAIDSPDSGRTAFVFDLASNLREKITANLRAAGQRIVYSYDFNRLATIAYPRHPENNVAYVYGAPGAAENGAGRVIRMTAGSGTTERGYGPLGELVRETKTVASDAGPDPVYVTRWRYDAWGRLQSLTYPDGEVLDFGYDSSGLVTRIAGRKGDDAYAYLRFMGYDRFEARERVVQGNGAGTDYAYHPLHRRLSGLVAKTPANRAFMDMAYAYDPAGAVTALANAAPLPAPPLKGGPTRFAFAYDDLHQLTGAEGEFRSPPDRTDRFTLSLRYDSIHNITDKTQLAGRVGNKGEIQPDRKITYDWAYEYGSAKPHAATHIGDRTFLYDLNGAQVGWDHDRSGARRRVVFDEDNRIQSVADGPTTAFKYDDDATRVIKRGPGGETIYVNAWYVDNAGRNSKHVFAGATRIATKLELPPKSQPPGGGGPGVREKFFYFYHPDHLGSTSYVTDQSGEVYQHLEYFPFGETWMDESPGNAADRTPYRFTGKEFDEETGLYYFGARCYDPRISLWTAADPALGAYLDVSKSEPKTPSHMSDWRAEQAGIGEGGVYSQKNLNSYSYAHQNPLKLVDDEGRTPVLILTGGIGSAIGGLSYVARQAYVGEEITLAGAGAAIATGAAFGSGAVLLPSTTAILGIAATGYSGGYVLVRASEYGDLSPQDQRAVQADAFLVVAGAGAARLAGGNYKATRQKPGGATPGTSESSEFFRVLIDKGAKGAGRPRFRRGEGWAPTTVNPFSKHFYFRSRFKSTSIGRTAPYALGGEIPWSAKIGEDVQFVFDGKDDKPHPALENLQ